jgi:hypothetical protein
VSGYLRVFLLLRSRQWPRYREGARKDERAWIASLSDRELAQLAAELGRIDRVVRDFREAGKGAEKFAEIFGPPTENVG